MTRKKRTRRRVRTGQANPEFSKRRLPLTLPKKEPRLPAWPPSPPTCVNLIFYPAGPGDKPTRSPAKRRVASASCNGRLRREERR